MGRYWEAFGVTRDKILAIQKARDAAKKEMLAFAKRNGTKEYGLSESFSVSFVLKFKSPPDPKLWKKLRHHDYYVPKESSAQGKALASEMYDIAVKCPGGCEVNKAIGFKNWVAEGRWFSAGFAVVGKRVLVSAPDQYTPPKGVDMKRISDTVFERLTTCTR